MIKKRKSSRIIITLECKECRKKVLKNKKGVSRYVTKKNRRNTPSKISLLKHCKYCNTHTEHEQIK
jgi:large subunit ribosomal protein L33